jgi:hypothetical protein
MSNELKAEIGAYVRIWVSFYTSYEKVLSETPKYWVTDKKTYIRKDKNLHIKGDGTLCCMVITEYEYFTITKQRNYRQLLRILGESNCIIRYSYEDLDLALSLVNQLCELKSKYEKI